MLLGGCPPPIFISVLIIPSLFFLQYDAKLAEENASQDLEGEESDVNFVHS